VASEKGDFEGSLSNELDETANEMKAIKPFPLSLKKMVVYSDEVYFEKLKLYTKQNNDYFKCRNFFNFTNASENGWVDFYLEKKYLASRYFY
jgi:hypothetical protein